MLHSNGLTQITPLNVKIGLQLQARMQAGGFYLNDPRCVTNHCLIEATDGTLVHRLALGSARLCYAMPAFNNFRQHLSYVLNMLRTQKWVCRIWHLAIAEAHRL